mmetsp:Transcript_7785/g.22096  ORF Transcript_7785/g.22096 Transcript_7785/m.22096 type:complete len:227 (-) Transcript_7785:633-1313(-)
MCMGPTQDEQDSLQGVEALAVLSAARRIASATSSFGFTSSSAESMQDTTRRRRAPANLRVTPPRQNTRSSFVSQGRMSLSLSRSQCGSTPISGQPQKLGSGIPTSRNSGWVTKLREKGRTRVCKGCLGASSFARSPGCKRKSTSGTWPGNGQGSRVSRSDIPVCRVEWTTLVETYGRVGRPLNRSRISSMEIRKTPSRVPHPVPMLLAQRVSFRIMTLTQPLMQPW